jgi:polysaccharide biosynthesis protein PslG
MPDFGRIVGAAYEEILEREPDPGGLENFNRLMNEGMSEAGMREALLRSPEFARKNPDLPARLGLNVHIPSEAILDDVALGLGMRWIRVDFDWFRIEPAQGAFRWQDLDRAVSRAAARGLEVLATLAYTPPWASSRPSDPRISDPPASTAYWTDIVGRAVARFGDRVRYWQLWNEPNVTQFWTGAMSQYRTDILEPGAAAAREASPGIRVVAPGLANLRDWRAWFREILQAAGVIDIVNHHNYASDGQEVLDDLERDRPGLPSLRTLLRELGVEDRPFWLTETGRRSEQGNQLEYYEDVVSALGERAWVSRLFFFHYWDGPGQGDGGFGIVNQDRSPKPAYSFLRSILLSGERPAPSLE